ncbi:hypothetical protein GCM10010299_02090 [Streptomyces tanashiensis]|nr:hypothetical protein GCM10010299_02090 [Streptomyces tanashiensis]
MARMLARAHSSQKYSRRPFSTEQVQVTGRGSAVLPQRAQETGSWGTRASFTLSTITRRGAAARTTHRGGRSVRTGPREALSVGQGRGITAMLSA